MSIDAWLRLAVADASDTVTLVLKTGSLYTFEAAAYHDNLALSRVSTEPVPTLPAWTLALLAGLLALLGAHCARSTRRSLPRH